MQVVTEQIFVKTFLKEAIFLDVHPRALLDDVKFIIEFATGVPVSLQRLVIEGVELQGFGVLSDYNICSKSILLLETVELDMIIQVLASLESCTTA